ncbi:hypothetical protein BIV57_21405 [Mangrovactinospora gilvigrisea]|uniref:Integral membrane protein n=1 Tax=Mangrovactinospora gilvigrisea TaxID=1428644 RepID=A0A1J7B9Z6_9ACTN|nr:hypothetical protein [Mangrovactinospora gilvigrisea]OIV35475.1 hypothetical protein BIV57_21405 [Mangrovactinospora gilvigrisea]
MSSGHNTDERDPFAPPPKDAPERPWAPRRAEDAAEQDGSGSGSSEPPRRPNDGRSPGRARPPVSTKKPSGGGQQPPPSPWGRPPGPPQDRRPGEFRPTGSGGGGGMPPGPRFDPADPVQRRARYALLGGMWGVFFTFFGYSEIGLLLGSLALYWAISSMRGQKRGATPEAEAERALARHNHEPSPAAAARPPARPAASAAVGGLVAAVIALVLVASTYAVQFVYKPYFDCVSDALTQTAKQSCSVKLPSQLHNMFGVDDGS